MWFNEEIEGEKALLFRILAKKTNNNNSFKIRCLLQSLEAVATNSHLKTIPTLLSFSLVLMRTGKNLKTICERKCIGSRINQSVNFHQLNIVYQP